MKAPEARAAGQARSRGSCGGEVGDGLDGEG